MKKKLIISFILLLLFSSYKPQKLFFSNKFNIKEIKIENNHILTKKNLNQNLTILYEKNLIFLKTYDIAKILKKIDFIESFEIKKIYPSNLKIKIYEKKPIAILHNKKKKFYISDNFKLIGYKDLIMYQNLPIVFGNKENFKILYVDLKKINFPLNLISKYYLYESRRWDIETHEKIIIRLPHENFIKSLENFIILRKKNNFKKYKIFDYRISNQLILK